MDQELVEHLSGMESRLGAKLDAGVSEVRRDLRNEIGAAVEHFDGRVQLLAELVQMQGEQHERRHVEIWTELSGLGRRMTHLEARVLDLSDRIR